MIRELDSVELGEGVGRTGLEESVIGEKRDSNIRLISFSKISQKLLKFNSWLIWVQLAHIGVPVCAHLTHRALSP